ncbi:MAG: hypothetical protein NT163_01825 [Chlorobiales bacterium]|nr:hypothetical protein [Chlorobiales bacterium]
MHVFDIKDRLSFPCRFMLLFMEVVILHVAGNLALFQIGIVFFASVSRISRYAIRNLSILALKRFQMRYEGCCIGWLLIQTEMDDELIMGPEFE